jgi:TP901 family phage tail tape measure protein
MSAKKTGMTISTIFAASDMMSKPLNSIAGAAGRAAKALGTIGIGVSIGTVIDFTKQAITTTIDYEKTLTGAVTKINPALDSTSKEFKAMDALARQLGIDTEFSATQAAAGIEELAAAGWSTEQILSGLPSIVDIATAAQVDFASATAMVNSALNIYGLNAEKAAYVGDVMMQAGNVSAASMQYMSNALVRAGASAKSVSVPFEELNASIAVLSNSGLTAEVAGTGLSTLFTRITKQPKEFADAVAAAGIVLNDAEGNFIGMTAVLDQISAAASGMNEMERGAFFASLSGGGAGAKSVLQVLAGNTEQIKEFTAALIESEGASGVVARRMRGTTAGFVASLNSVKEGLQLALGTAFLPALTEILSRFTDILRPLAPYFTLFGNLLGKAAVMAFNLASALIPIAQTLMPLLISSLAVYIGLTARKIALDAVAFGRQAFTAISAYFAMQLKYLAALRPAILNYGRATQFAAILSQNFARATATLGGRLTVIALAVGGVITVVNFLADNFGALPAVIGAVVVALGLLAIAFKIVGMSNPFGFILTIISAVVTVIGVILKKLGVLQKIGGWFKKVFGNGDAKAVAMPGTVIDSETGALLAETNSSAGLSEMTASSGIMENLPEISNFMPTGYDMATDNAYASAARTVAQAYTVDINIYNNSSAEVDVDANGTPPPGFTLNRGGAR